MTALATRAHYEAAADTALAIRLVEALRTLEQAKRDADKADVYCQGDDYERCWFDLRTAQIEVDRITDQLGLRERYSGRAGA